jgi:hypothetical protein
MVTERTAIIKVSPDRGSSEPVEKQRFLRGEALRGASEVE